MLTTIQLELIIKDDLHLMRCDEEYWAVVRRWVLIGSMQAYSRRPIAMNAWMNVLCPVHIIPERLDKRLKLRQHSDTFHSCQGCPRLKEQRTEEPNATF